jgi:anti-sigma factor RsiW
MSNKSVPLRHWTDDELIDHLYGIGPEDSHLAACADCRARLLRMEARREALNSATEGDVSHDFLAAQRRSIYARITQPVRWWQQLHLRRWASALATVSLLAAGLVYYQSVQRQHELREQLSDAELAQEVSSMAQDPEPSPTAPLQGLFEE